MKLSTVVLMSTILGVAAGVTLAYVSVGPATQLAVVPTRAADPPKPAGTPVAFIAEPKFNFGRMVRGATKSHEFIIENTGQADLTLSVGKTSCKCTLGDVSGRPIPPGESASVRLEWVAKVYAGPFRQTATVITNDPNNSPITLSVSGEVTEISGLDPGVFDLGDFNTDEPATTSVVFRSFEQPEVEISASMTEPIDRAELFSVDVTQLEDPDVVGDAAAAWRVMLRVEPGLPLGPTRGWVAIETSLPDYDRFLVPVTGQVRGAISIRGRGWNDRLGLLNIGPVVSAEGANKTLLLWCRGSEAAAVEFEIAEVDPPELIVELGDRQVKKTGEDNASSFTPLKVSIPPGTRSMVRMDRIETELATGDGDAIIRLRSNHSSVPEIELKVRFAVEG